MACSTSTHFSFYKELKFNSFFESYLSILPLWKARIIFKARTESFCVNFKPGLCDDDLEDTRWNCIFCDIRETVEHFLIECNFYRYYRGKYFSGRTFDRQFLFNIIEGTNLTDLNSFSLMVADMTNFRKVIIDEM